MKTLSELLNRISSSLNKDSRTKESIALVIEQETGAKVTSNNLFLKNKTLEVQASAVVKNEIRLREQEIKNRIFREHGLNLDRIFYK